MLLKPKYYQLETNYSQEEVFKILFENTIEKKIRFFTPKKEFQGKIYNDYFEIQKVINSRNSFNPSIIGTFKPISSNKTLIKIQLKQNSFTFIFCIFWLSFVSIFLIGSLILTNLFAIGISLIMLFFGSMLMYIGPLLVKNQIKESFEKLFQTKIKEIKP
ncbi:hypothetical protein EAH69_05120 [Faecalibacter macacae]|uniref:Uncharacterized protein n=1 Tax=Faecalibacter macacae TaxID=1859289 RepID=A0A3L9MEB0_9FLAO|nr:hypothetical protein EAH69_05120 [Faecalibacter macacae]